MPDLLPIALLITLGITSSLCDPLLLTPMIEAGKLPQARAASSVSLSRLYSGTSHAGYLTADRQLGNHLYFWYFPSQQNSSAPLLLWLNGGPGVSSLQGVFWENGPVMIDPVTFTPQPRPSNWVGPFSVLYIDNPVGVGFSYSDSGDQGLRLTREGYTDDLYSVLRQFYKLFPENYDRDLYIGGQSYAGKYIPALGERIHWKNQNCDQPLPLVGVYLGGPMVNFINQTLANFDFIYQMGFDNKFTLDQQRQNVTELGHNKTVAEVFQIYNELNYDFLLKDNFNDPTALADISINKLLQDKEIKNALHVGDKSFETYSGAISMMYGIDLLRPTNEELALLLENYKVLIYNGNYDAAIPTSSTDMALLTTDWSKREEFRTAKRLPWTTPDASGMDKVRGYFSKTCRLCRVVVHAAGHQVPHDKPGPALHMMEAFVNKGCL